MWNFANQNPWAAFWIVVFIFWGLASIVRQISRTIRVLKAGWPPAHLDADGESITRDLK